MYPQIGTDLEENHRFERLIDKPSFLRGVYTPNEQAYIAASYRPATAACGIFCAKEAVAKALGDGLFGLRPQDIAIGHDAQGRPVATLTGGARAKYPDAVFSLSISHTKAYSVATCLVLPE